MSNKDAILVLTSTFPRWSGDCEPPFVYELSKRLARKFDVYVLAPHAAGASVCEVMEGVTIARYRYFVPQLQSLAYNGGILANLKKNVLNYILIPFFLFFQFISVIRLIRKYPIKLIHAHWLIPQAGIALLACVIAGKKIPVICTSHGGDLFGLQGKVFSWVKQVSIQRLAQLVVVSSAMREYVSALTDRKDVEVISMGVDLVDRFSLHREIVRDPQQILFVGRLVEKKGVSFLILAMRDVLHFYPKAQLLIVGDGPERSRLELLAGQIGIADRILFTGAVPNSELGQYYRKSSIFVAPSIIADDGDQEGLGLVLVEAMGCGCTVVASNLKAMGDVVTDGVTGLICEQKDSQSIANALLKLLGNEKLRLALAQAGREHVLRHFDWQPISGRYEALIAQCLTSSHN